MRGYLNPGVYGSEAGSEMMGGKEKILGIFLKKQQQTATQKKAEKYTVLRQERIKCGEEKMWSVLFRSSERARREAVGKI